MKLVVLKPGLNLLLAHDTRKKATQNIKRANVINDSHLMVSLSRNDKGDFPIPVGTYELKIAGNPYGTKPHEIGIGEWYVIIGSSPAIGAACRWLRDQIGDIFTIKD